MHSNTFDIVFRCRRWILAPAILVACCAIAEDSAPNGLGEYNTHIRRILANNCFKCHGQDGDARKADLRLDTPTGAFADGAIIPGDPASSKLMARILSNDPAEKMPPPDSNRTLNADEIEQIRHWIADGAQYEEHWAFVPPQQHPLPAVANPQWPRNPLDYFVLARLDAEDLQPAPEADRYTLARRVALDLTGLPPDPDEVTAFINDTSPVAYETYVRKLLDSPHYGERWARMWLDLARYADTKGYEADRGRTMWRYRDWVIDAYNADMPYDAFTIEQLAGDLLPNPTTDQLIATAFHRNTMTNDEGGTDNEEFRDAAVVDRVNTTMETWMGLTMACAQCHTHKYDPITQNEFYEFYAFFNQSADADLYPVETPVIPTPTTAQSKALDALTDRIAFATDRRDRAAATMAGDRTAWEQALLRGESDAPIFSPWQVSPPFPADKYDTAFETAFGPESKLDLTGWTAHPDWADGETHELPGDVVATYLYRTATTSKAQPVEISLGSNDGLRVWINGAEVLSNPTTRSVAPDQDKITAELKPGENTILLKVVNSGGGHGYYFKALVDALPEAVLAAVAIPAAERTAEQAATVDTYWKATAPGLAPYREELAALDQEKKRLEEAIPSTPIMQELTGDERRETHIHVRGSYLNPGDPVSPAVPAVFPAMTPEEPLNRLGLAKWLVDRRNPLTARVAVNRYWEAFFGTGIVETSEDFGTQGELPTHPALLDWLAVEFMKDGWSMKDLCYLIVTSATYRQSSAVTPELFERDPYNRLLARGPRFRLSAEAVRDQALAVSGLLNGELKGPSVMPFQPEGVWQVVYNGEDWETSPGDERHRRGLYTYWRRTAPYPSMIAFDAPSREVCTVRRIRTNTPLQAFVTLNDPVYVEAAQALARRMTGHGGTPAEIAGYGVQSVIVRPATDDETAALTRLYESEFAHYTDHRDDAVTLSTQPLGPLPDGADPAEYAAWTVVANVLLNMDETLTKR